MNNEPIFNEAWTHNGVKVSVDHYGNFCAEVDGERIWERSLADLHRKIDAIHLVLAKQKSVVMGLKVVGLLQQDRPYGAGTHAKYGMHHDVQRGMHRTTGMPLYEGRLKDHTFNWVCVDTPEAVAALENLLQAQAALVAAEDATKRFAFNGGGQRDASAVEYPELVNAVIERYRAALAALAK